MTNLELLDNSICSFLPILQLLFFFLQLFVLNYKGFIFLFQLLNIIFFTLLSFFFSISSPAKQHSVKTCIVILNIITPELLFYPSSSSSAAFQGLLLLRLLSLLVSSFSYIMAFKNLRFLFNRTYSPQSHQRFHPQPQSQPQHLQHLPP